MFFFSNTFNNRNSFYNASRNYRDRTVHDVLEANIKVALVCCRSF